MHLAAEAFPSVSLTVQAGAAVPVVTAALQRTPSLPTVFFGAVPVTPSFGGLAPGFAGLYEVIVQAPPALAPGAYPILLAIDLAHSNTLNLTVP